jgi:hypothetical protein
MIYYFAQKHFLQDKHSLTCPHNMDKKRNTYSYRVHFISILKIIPSHVYNLKYNQFLQNFVF